MKLFQNLDRCGSLVEFMLMRYIFSRIEAWMLLLKNISSILVYRMYDKTRAKTKRRSKLMKHPLCALFVSCFGQQPSSCPDQGDGNYGCSDTSSQ